MDWLLDKYKVPTSKFFANGIDGLSVTFIGQLKPAIIVGIQTVDRSEQTSAHLQLSHHPVGRSVLLLPIHTYTAG